MIRKKKDRGTTEYVDPEMLGNPEPAEENDNNTEGTDEGETDESEVVDHEGNETSAEETAAAEFKAGFEAWADGRFDDEALRETLAMTIDTIVEAVTGGKTDEALFELLARGADYDRAIAEAVEEAETRGRNARIEELMLQEGEDDGVPHPGTGSMGDSRTPSIFELARGAY